MHCWRSTSPSWYTSGRGGTTSGRRSASGSGAALREALREPRLDFFGVIAEGARLPLVDDGPRFVDDVEALRPPRVHRVGGILDRVDQQRDLVGETLDEVVGNRDALLAGRRLGIADAFRDVGV